MCLPSFVFGTVGEVNENVLWVPFWTEELPIDPDVALGFKCEFMLLPACTAKVCAAWVNDAIVEGGSVKAELIEFGKTPDPKAAACAAAYSWSCRTKIINKLLKELLILITKQTKNC